MSTPFYDLASLVLVPSGYKTSKVYAQKPLTTDGQLAFTRSTTATRVNSAGLIESVAINVPRLDYLNSSCPRLLLEPQRTNLATYNEAFSNWGPSAGTITSNATTSPDGYVDADLFTEDTTTGYHRFANSCTGATGTTKTYSIYAKWAGGTGRKWLTIDNGPLSFFDLENGVLGIAGANCTNSITPVGNGWYRCVMTHTASSVGTMYVGTSNTNGGAGNHLGNGQPAFYVWGAQCEDNASYPTSVIPTLGAAVTRGADACSKTGISSLIGQSEGTLFAEVNYKSLSANARFITISNGTVNNLVQFYLPPNLNTLLAYIAINGTVVFNGNVKALTNINAFFKIAMAYKNGNSRIYVDGQLLQTITTSFSSGTFDRFNFANQTGGQAFEGEANSVLIFPTALSNSDLAALTA